MPNPTIDLGMKFTPKRKALLDHILYTVFRAHVKSLNDKQLTRFRRIIQREEWDRREKSRF